MEKLKEIIDRGYTVEITSHDSEDYREKPELREMDAFRVNVIKGNDVYKFDAEYADDWLNGFGEILDQIIEYIDVYLQ